MAGTVLELTCIVPGKAILQVIATLNVILTGDSQLVTPITIVNSSRSIRHSTRHICDELTVITSYKDKLEVVDCLHIKVPLSISD